VPHARRLTARADVTGCATVAQRRGRDCEPRDQQRR
jgi:hypothetical protein